MHDETESPESTDGQPGRKEQHWNQRMTDIEDFVTQDGCLPRDSRARRADPAAKVELRLARFLRYQRHNELHLTEAQQARLDKLPGFDWSPVETAWEQRCEDYRSFIRTRGRVPRRRSTDRSERELALWHYRQTLRYSRGLLPHHLWAPFRRLANGVHGADKNP